MYNTPRTQTLGQSCPNCGANDWLTVKMWDNHGNSYDQDEVECQTCYTTQNRTELFLNSVAVGQLA